MKIYNSFKPEKIKFIYIDDRYGRQITCGLTLFIMTIKVMNPHLVIDHQSKESKMEYLTIKTCENNVRTYLKKMQDMQNEIDSFLKNRIKYDEQRFLTLTFNELGKTSRDLFA